MPGHRHRNRRVPRHRTQQTARLSQPVCLQAASAHPTWRGPIVTRARATTARTTPQRQLPLPALEIQQGPNRRIYPFAIDGKHVGDIAAVARVRRDDQTRLHGYQRPESLAHVGAIRRYLDTDPSPLLPNAIVIAFDE